MPVSVMYVILRHSDQTYIAACKPLRAANLLFEDLKFSFLTGADRWAWYWYRQTGGPGIGKDRQVALVLVQTDRWPWYWYRQTGGPGIGADRQVALVLVQTEG